MSPESDDSPSPRALPRLELPAREEARPPRDPPPIHRDPPSPTRREPPPPSPIKPTFSATLPRPACSRDPAPEEDWKEKMKQMRDQIKKVQELPKVEVPKTLAKRMTSASSPDLTLYSSPSKTSHIEASWEIRARYRNMRTEELYQTQMVKKSGYSWREKVPEIQSQKLKFSEMRSNVVTDVAFIGATYVQVRRLEMGIRSYIPASG
jgi:hypothetical protein